MGNINDDMLDRFYEVERYLEFIVNLDNKLKLGENLSVEGAFENQKVFKSSVYLLLYNLVEATITRCLKEVALSCTSMGDIRPKDLNESLKSEWFKFMNKTSRDSNKGNNITSVEYLYKNFTKSPFVTTFEIDKGGGGNWGTKEIEDIAKRIGCDLKIDYEVLTGVKKHVYDNLGYLAFVVKMRNKLAHGEMSFEECGKERVVSELQETVKCVINYLKALISEFESFIDQKLFLIGVEDKNFLESNM